MARLLSLVALLGTALAHEHHGTTLFPRSSSSDLPPPSFGYHGLSGPLNWHNLNRTTNSLCAKGTHQSPIDLSPAHLASPSSASHSNSKPKFSVAPAPHGADFLNLGTTVEVLYPNGTYTNAGKTSKLAQFHFHSPSEHSIDGVYYPLEVHFVFQAEQDASLSVVGFLIDISGGEGESGLEVNVGGKGDGKGGESERLLQVLAKSLGEIEGRGNETITAPLGFEGVERHFEREGVYQYAGSLTTPPCSEGVSWTVSAKPLHVDIKAFNAFKEVLKFNARYTQNGPGGVNLLQNAADTLH